MSPVQTRTEPARSARLLAVCCAVYLGAHFFGSSLRAIPTSEELATLDAKGMVTLSAPELREWYLDSHQRENFSEGEVERQNKQLRVLEAEVGGLVESYNTTTDHSNKERVGLLTMDLNAGRFSEALTRWTEVETATSPKTLAKFGRNSADKLRVNLVGLQTLEISQRMAVFELRPRGEPGFLWTSPSGAPLEVFLLSSLVALAALYLRRRTLQRRGYNQVQVLSASALRHAVLPLVALLAWSFIRPRIEFSQLPLAIVLTALAFGLILPYAARAISRLVGNDPEQPLRRAQASERKGRIVTAMKDLRPSSFADLKKAASQFAAELVSADVEEHPQP